MKQLMDLEALSQFIREIIREEIHDQPHFNISKARYHPTLSHNDIKIIVLLLEKVGKKLNIENKTFYNASTSTRNAWPRQIVMYLLQEDLGWGPNKAANVFWKTHGTAFHAKKLVEDRMETEVAIETLINSLKSKS
jgi:chromosomal replication initiation ATPase DnaA